jgi:hypothetical protein
MLIPVIALAFISFLFSAFVILRIVIPILPPHPLSRRVPPSEFGLPNFRSLSPADKSHIWLASLDIFALILFAWQAVSEYNGGASGFAIASDPAAAARVWLALTLRQTCLLVVSALTLLHVRLGRSVTFGTKHWMLWSPMVVLVVATTTIASVLAGTNVTSFFVGLTAYTTTVALISSACFMCLIGTLLAIKRNLAVLNEAAEPWPPASAQSDLPRPSFATEEVDMLKDGASWITSYAGSRRNSGSAWSFSTHHTQAQASQCSYSNTAIGSKLSAPAKSAMWFNTSTTAPPVPPLPTQYCSTPPSPTAESLHDPDPFRRHSPANSMVDLQPGQQRPRFGSQTSWLTSSQGSHTTLTAWSFPATHYDNGSMQDIPTSSAGLLAPPTPRPSTPAVSSAQVLGGYGYNPTHESEKGIALAKLAAPPGTEVDISIWRLVGWLVMIWTPMVLSYPYLITAHMGQQSSSSATQILLALSLATSSPILAFNILLRSPLPIPIGLFDIRSNSPTTLKTGSGSTLPTHFSHEYKQSNGTTVSNGFLSVHKRSTSTGITVVEGRRSGDVWLTNGNAKDGNGKFSRAMTMLDRVPKLSVLPVDDDTVPITPPLPIQDPSASMSLVHKHAQSLSQGSAELGRLRKESELSVAPVDESLGFTSRIMVAHRHVSAMAHTVVIPASPPTATGFTTAIADRRVSHLRSRSHSSVISSRSSVLAIGAAYDNSASPSPPPSCPLPPTPPNLRAARLAQLKHKKSFSSGYSLHAFEDAGMNQIDELTAQVLPLLVPGLKVGGGMRITKGNYSPPGTGSTAVKEFGFNSDGEFSSPQIHSTPYTVTNARRERKMTDAHKRNHMSLPSLGLGKDGVKRWSADITTALQNKVIKTPYKEVELTRRNTIWGSEMPADLVQEKQATMLTRTVSTRKLGILPDVPHGISVRMSYEPEMAMANFAPPKSSTQSSFVPPSAASTATLFDLDMPMSELEKNILEEEGPLAESTPHSTVHHKTARQADKRSKSQPKLKESKGARRSSIVYIKSSENVDPAMSTVAEAPSTSSGFVAGLIPKAGGHIHRLRAKLHSTSPPSHSNENSSSSSPSGLRPLSLLRERDANSDQSAGSITMPLKIGKKKSKGKLNAENDDPSATSSRSGSFRGLKPLRLARSDTSKVRGALRKQETLPDVVVRPPSTSQHVSYGYSFHE